MDNLGNILTGTAALVMAIVALSNTLNKKKKGAIERLESNCAQMHNDLCLIKKASFYALDGAVQLGANGDAKKAHQELKDSLFNAEGDTKW